MTQRSLSDLDGYVDSRRNRILLRDGRSVVSPFQAARLILEGKDVGCVPTCRETEIYETIYGDKIGTDVEEIVVEEENHDHTDEDIDFVLDMIHQSPRWTGSDEQISRVETEMEFFIETYNIIFILYIIDMIQGWKDNGTVWGVGRGSASASLVMYLLEVHDVDPLKYKIPFSEMSKVQERWDD